MSSFQNPDDESVPPDGRVTVDLNAMTVFARVAQCGSFSAAARALGMPKSTVSRRVAELEQQLGARLLQRTTRRLALTDVGQTYFRHCARIAAEVEEAERAVSEHQSEPRGTLRVTAPMNFEFLGPIVARYLEENPGVELELMCADRVIDLVQEGFDIAIRAGKLVDSSLVARGLGAHRAQLVASPRYLERAGTPRTPSALERHDGILFGANGSRRTWQLERERERIAVSPRARLVVNDYAVMTEATLAGLGVALLPEVRVAAAVAEGQLLRVLPRWSAPEVPLQAVYPSTRHIAPKVRSFLEHLRALPRSLDADRRARTAAGR
ncbi:MAG: LysR family transcriptional regulator [Deltaproteobacteria bacterium]|nr:LysR family transcriptional regulator [Deltaproteobacteria bacterium]